MSKIYVAMSMPMQWYLIFTNVGLVSFLLNTIRVTILRILPFSLLVGQGYLTVLFFYNIWVYIYNTLGYSYVRKIVLVSIRFRNRIHPSSNSGIQRLSHLDIPTKCYYLTGITILIIMTRFLIP